MTTNQLENFWQFVSLDSSIVEQGFAEESIPTVYNLEFPNANNSTETTYTSLQKQKQNSSCQYTQYDFNNLNFYKQDLNNKVQSSDRIKELFKFWQNKGFGTWL